MKRLLTALALLAGACSNPDNVVNGGAAATATTPIVVFNTVGSSISGVVTRTDSTTPSWVVALSDAPGLCDALALHPDLFRNARGPYNAIVLFMPAERLGFFEIGRDVEPEARAIARKLSLARMGSLLALLPLGAGTAVHLGNQLAAYDSPEAWQRA